MKEPAYISLANKIAAMIENGIYKPGDKLPSLRSLHKEHGLSVGTILQAFNHLVDKELITAQEKSGYYVNAGIETRLPLPQSVPLSLSERSVHIDQLLQRLNREGKGRHFVTFATALPDDRLLPYNSIKRAIQEVSRDAGARYLMVEDRMGSLPLREEIAKRCLLCSVHPEEMVITNGATEAILCSLRAVTKPGDTVLIQDPCFYGVMQVLECLELKVATIPSDPEKGIDVQELKEMCRTLNIKACVLVSNFNNPDGAMLSTARKKEIAAFAKEAQLPIIEDDLYGDLFFTGSRPDTIKAYDIDGWVMYCNSFTKTLVPGFRIGWCAAGRFTYQVARIKSMHNGATANFTQRVVHQLLRSGVYDRHLHKFRMELFKNMRRMTSMIASHFPAGTRITRPLGGMVLWVELPEHIHTGKLQDTIFKEGIAYAPGEVYSTKGDYTHYLRLSYADVWEQKLEHALIRLGQLLQ